LQTAEARSQKPESRIVTACLKSDPQETPQRHAVRGRGFSPGGCSGGCYLALGARAVRTAEPANLEVKMGMASRSFPASFLTSNLWPPTSKMVGSPLGDELRASSAEG